MSEPCVIRNAVPEDANHLARLLLESESGVPLNPQVFHNAFHELLNMSWACFIVAENQDTPVGFLLAFIHPTLFSGNAAWVETVLVARSYQKQGVGTLLLAKAERWAADRKAALMAVPAIPSALPFYDRLGYKDAAFRLVKTLGNPFSEKKR
jgi:GNAT superfamily N-acetyltransferase